MKRLLTTLPFLAIGFLVTPVAHADYGQTSCGYNADVASAQSAEHTAAVNLTRSRQEYIDAAANGWAGQTTAYSNFQQSVVIYNQAKDYADRVTADAEGACAQN